MATGMKRLAQAAVAAIALASAGLAVGQVAVVPANPNPPVKVRTHVKRVLLYNYTFGGHSKTPIQQAMTRLATKYGFQLDVAGNNDYITPATLAGVDVAIFTNGDGDVLENATSLAAMKDFIQVKGKGLLQTHAAAAYIPCPTSGQENLTDNNCRWLARVLVRQYLHHDGDPTEARVYVDSVKQGEVPPNSNAGSPAATINHGRSNPETRMIFEGLPVNGRGTNPAQKYVWDDLGDEWYNYRGNPRSQGAQIFDGVTFGPVNVLLALDEKSWASSVDKMGDHPCAWARKVGVGLTVYNNAGHSDVYTRARGTKSGTPVRDSLMEKMDWNMLRYLARDFVGCMDPKYTEYNPEATVTTLTAIDNPTPCGTPTTITMIPVGGQPLSRVLVNSGRIQVPLFEAGHYQVQLLSPDGRVLASRTGEGGDGRLLEIAQPESGSFLVRVTAPHSGVSAAKVIP